MAPKELWKAKVGFQKQKLIALHLAFQCHVALSPKRTEWGAFTQTWGLSGACWRQDFQVAGRPLAADRKCHRLPTGDPDLLVPPFPCPQSQPQVQGTGLYYGESPGDAAESLRLSSCHCPFPSVLCTRAHPRFW